MIFWRQHMVTAEEYRESEARHLKAFQIFDPERAATYSDERLALAHWMQNAGAPAIVLGRARYAEDNLEQAVKAGVKQYVILGAGMDTFAVRRPDLVKHLQVFEVDHPATQAHKRQRLLATGQELPASQHFLPVDFSQENLADGPQTHQRMSRRPRVSLAGWASPIISPGRRCSPPFAPSPAAPRQGARSSSIIWIPRPLYRRKRPDA